MGEMVIYAVVKRPDGEYDGWLGGALADIQEVAEGQNPHVDKSSWKIMPSDEIEAMLGTPAFTTALEELKKGAKAAYLGRVAIFVGVDAA